MIFDSRSLVVIALAFAASLVLTPVVRNLARRLGMVSHPRADRWAKKPTALLGGIAIFVSVMLGSLFLANDVEHGGWILGASAFLFVVGLVDDLLHIKPYQKLIGQIMGACVIILGGLALPWTGSPLLDRAFTVLWLVGITNAINLLDNMDGLAAGVAAIAAIFLGVNFLASGQVAEAALLGVFTVVLVGFLVYNSNPASIFMGDCGSMFIGFFLASTALSHVSGGRSTSLFSVLAVPVLLLVIPIFDTTLVTVVRKLSGRPASQGGRDHTSHRLVALGLTERRAVALLYALATLAGVLALCVRNLPTDVSLVLVAVFTLSLTFLGIHLARVKVYEESQSSTINGHAVAGFLVNLSHKRRVFEVLLDVALISLAYYAAHVMFYGPLGEDGAWDLLLNTLPVLIVVKLGAFLTMGVYRGLWRYVGINDLLVYVKAVAFGSVLSVLVFLFFFRFASFSRVVFVLDGLFLLPLLAGSRMTFRFLRSLFPMPHAAGGRRVLIYGAGDAGVMLLREMHNNPELGCAPVGFADDDPLKTGKAIHGLPVFGGNGSLPKICQENRIEEVYISSSRFTDERVREIREQCREIDVGLKRLRIQFETLQEPTLATVLSGQDAS
jgi:UDP-GlcNAc:undecaprenyl-phosphate/decaprenyl-phosphate GlcNAc-1-phosphate transferase